MVNVLLRIIFFGLTWFGKIHNKPDKFKFGLFKTSFVYMYDVPKHLKSNNHREFDHFAKLISAMVTVWIFYNYEIKFRTKPNFGLIWFGKIKNKTRTF